MPCQDASRTVGKICPKSPSRTTILPSNDFWVCKVDFMVLSNALKQYMCIIAASSHIISLALISSSAWGLCCFMLQVEYSSTIIGIVNLDEQFHGKVLSMQYHLMQH